MQRTTRTNTNGRLWWTVLVLAALAALFAPPTAAGDRVVAHIYQPFEVAGQSFDGGALSIRTVHVYSPVSTLHEVSVDGRCLGLLMAHESLTEPSSRDELIFTRRESGALVLRGLAMAGEPERSFVDVALAAPARTASAGAEADALMAEARNLN